MKKYAKIINEETKEVSIALGSKFPSDYKEMDVERSYNCNWYVTGYAPEKPEPTKEEILAEKRIIRNKYLQDSDKYMLQDFPITSIEKNKWKEYRVYLRDFFNEEAIALISNVKTFEEYFA